MNIVKQFNINQKYNSFYRYNMTTIKIIFPYFGKFPPQFKFWWASALNNPGVNFLIVTDNKTVKSEMNIEVVYMTFDECRERVQRCFDFSIALPSPYKLCDFRPAYPLIFNDLIGDADFYGWGDIDLIYGNIREIVTEEVLAQYDVISGWGHLTLLRNNDYWKHFFELQVDGFQDYKTVYQDSKNFGFDEYWHGGTADKAKYLHADKVWDTRPFDDLRVPESNFNFKSGIRAMYENDYLIFEYKDKYMYRVYLIGHSIVKEPIMYMHFKRRLKMLKPCTNNTEKYLIVPNKIIDWEEPTFDKILAWSKCGLLKQYIFTMQSKVIGKLKKLLR